MYFGRIGSPKVSKREAFGAHFGDILGVRPKSENRCFTLEGDRFSRFGRVRKATLLDKI